MNLMNTEVRKLVAVGDGAVGKTCLFIALARGIFPSIYIPTVFESYSVYMEVKGERMELNLWDTAAQGDYEDRLRPLSYQYANAFLICFSIEQPDSLDNIQAKWDPELKYFGAGEVPRFLVGCKKDLRNDPEMISRLAQYLQTPITTEQGGQMAKAIGAEYFECSSKTGEGIRELFVRVTESMRAEKAVPGFRAPKAKHRRRHYTGGGGCIVV